MCVPRTNFLTGWYAREEQAKGVRVLGLGSPHLARARLGSSGSTTSFPPCGHGQLRRPASVPSQAWWAWLGGRNSQRCCGTLAHIHWLARVVWSAALFSLFGRAVQFIRAHTRGGGKGKQTSHPSAPPSCEHVHVACAIRAGAQRFCCVVNET